MGDPAGRAGRSEKHLSGAGHFGEREDKCLGNHPAPGFAGRAQGCPFPACGTAGENHPGADDGIPRFFDGRRIPPDIAFIACDVCCPHFV